MPQLHRDPETLMLGRWVGADGRGRSQCRRPRPLLPGAGDGETALEADNVPLTLPQRGEQEALQVGSGLGGEEREGKAKIVTGAG